MGEPDKEKAAGRAGFDPWVLAVRSVTALLVVAALVLLTYETLHQVVAVQPIPSTKATTDIGLTPEVAAQHLRDELAAIADGADGVNRPNLSLETQKPDLTLPGLGISVDTIAAYLRGILHIDAVREVSGDFTEQNQARIWLRIRVDGALVYQSPESGADPAHAQHELNLAARMVAREITPYLYAAYLHHIRDPAEIDALRDIVTARTADDGQMGDAERLWGQITAEHGDQVSAMEHYAAARRLYDQAGAAKRSATLQNYIGQAYLQTGDCENAKAAYRLALKAGPSWPSAATAWLNLGDVLRNNDNDQPAALAAYKSALSVDPHIRYARDAEGRTYEAMGRIKEAAKSYRESIEDYPGDAQSYVHLAQLIVAHPNAFPDPKTTLHWVCAMASAVPVSCIGAP